MVDIISDDLKLIRRKIREANKLPDYPPAQYNLKQDILRHWKLEKHLLEHCIKVDTIINK